MNEPVHGIVKSFASDEWQATQTRNTCLVSVAVITPTDADYNLLF